MVSWSKYQTTSGTITSLQAVEDTVWGHGQVLDLTVDEGYGPNRMKYSELWGQSMAYTRFGDAATGHLYPAGYVPANAANWLGRSTTVSRYQNTWSQSWVVLWL